MVLNMHLNMHVQSPSAHIQYMKYIITVVVEAQDKSLLESTVLLNQTQSQISTVFNSVYVLADAIIHSNLLTNNLPKLFHTINLYQNFLW